MLSEIIAVGADSINIFSQSANFNTCRGVDILESGNFSFAIVEVDLTVSDVVTSLFNHLFEVNNISLNLL